MDHLIAMKAWVRLVELGSFTRVSEDLRITQSTVSKWIATLEEELGTPLLDRTTRSQRVTDAGRLFYERCVELLAGWDKTVADLQANAPNLSGRLRVNAPVVFGSRYVVPHVATFMTAHPAIELELRMSDSYVNLLEDGADVAIRVGLAQDSSYRSRNLGSTARHLVASRAFVEANGSPTSPQELKALPCLVHTGLKGDHWTLSKAGQQHRVAVRGPVAANNSLAVRAFARAGMGVALLASWLVNEDLASGLLVSLMTDYQLPQAPIRAVMPPTRHTQPRVKAFVDHLQGRWGEPETEGLSPFGQT